MERTLRNVSWEELLAKMESKLMSWTHRFLTLLGRILSIKSVLLSMPLYLFFVLPAPTNIIKKIRNLQREFLWGGGKEKKWALVEHGTRFVILRIMGDWELRNLPSWGRPG